MPRKDGTGPDGKGPKKSNPGIPKRVGGGSGNRSGKGRGRGGSPSGAGRGIKRA